MYKLHFVNFILIFFIKEDVDDVRLWTGADNIAAAGAAVTATSSNI